MIATESSFLIIAISYGSVYFHVQKVISMQCKIPKAPADSFNFLVRLAVVISLVATHAMADVDGDPTPEPMRVLFIGNSYTSVNNLPGMIQAMARAAKEKRAFSYTTSTPGGWSFQQHLLDPNTKSPTQIARQSWDFVVLQEQSQMPFMYPKTTLEHGIRLGELVKAQNATPLFYLTWAREHQPEHQAAITKTYSELAKALDAPIAPVGLAWERARKEQPTIQLYMKDKSHPASAGSYLAASVFYAMIYGKSPIGLPGKLTAASNGKERILANLSAVEAKFLQEIAWTTVQAMKEPAKAKQSE